MPKVLLVERGGEKPKTVAELLDGGLHRVRPQDVPVDPTRDIDWRDAGLPGFVLRVFRSGVRSYGIHFRVRHGDAVRQGIGDVRHTSIGW